MTLGIIVPTFNRVRKLARLIECLQRQTFKDFHVYIVDSGSSDGTRELCLTFPVPSTLVKATPDHWWSAANNLGIRRALRDGCDLILTINDDAIILSDYLEKFLKVFKTHNLEICANRIDFADEPGKIWALGSYSTFGSPFLFQLKYNGYWFDELPEEIKKKEILPTMSVCGDGVLIHKKVFDQIGFFDETFTPQVHGDSEFSLRANNHGISVYVAPTVVLFNDIYNLSEEGSKADNRKFSKRFKDVFINKKSDCYWRPVLYITMRYSPKRLIFQTLVKFFVWKCFVFFYSDFAMRLIPPRKKSNLRLNLINMGIRFTRKLLHGLAIWIFDFQSYDNITIKHIIDDEKMRNNIDQIRAKIQLF